MGGRINGRTTGRNEKRRKEVGGKRREEGSADMPVYLGISCVKGGRGERRGGGRVEKEVESSTTLAGVTLEEVEQMLLQEKKGGRGGGVPMSILALFISSKDRQSTTFD